MNGPSINDIKPGDALPERELVCDTVQLFFYNAALWNAHRIHFDAPYATEGEGYPGLVVAGPLMGDWLTQVVLEWMGDEGELLSFEFSNRQAAYVDDPLVSGGTISAVDTDNGLVDIDLHILNAERQVITPGRARVRLPAG